MMAELQPSDQFLVNRDGVSYNVTQANLMAQIQDDDLMLVNRGSASYKITGAEVKDSFVDPIETELNSAITFKVLGSGSIAMGGTIDTTPDQSQANIFLNAESGKIKAVTAETSGTITSGGQLIAEAGADLTGTVTCNNSLNVTEGTAVNTLNATGLATLASLNAAYYDLNALDALPA